MKVKKWMSLVMPVLFQAYAAVVSAETYPDWMEQGGDLKEKTSNIFGELFDYVLFAAACAGALSMAIGLFRWSGWFSSQDREKGATQMKRGFIVIVASGAIKLIIYLGVTLAKS